MTKTAERINPKTGKPYENAPLITRAYENVKFGEGSYLTNELDGEAYDTIQKHVQIGGRLVFKKRKTQDGKPMFFVEVLPPREDSNSI